MPEFTPGDIVTHNPGGIAHYIIVAGPDSRGFYAATNQVDGEFHIIGGQRLILVTPTPATAEDTLTGHLAATVKRLERMEARLDIQDGFTSKLNKRLDDHSGRIARRDTLVAGLDSRLADVRSDLNEMIEWRAS